MRRRKSGLIGCLLLTVIAAVSVMVVKHTSPRLATDEELANFKGFTTKQQAERVPWDKLGPVFDKIRQEDPDALIGFYTSMRCMDTGCTDFEHHTHWCIVNCTDQSHGHSKKEYAESEERLSQIVPPPLDPTTSPSPSK